MIKKSATNNKNKSAGFGCAIGMKAKRKIHARRNAHHGVWFGLGMMGLIGWSIVIPTLFGAALGIWIDKRDTASYSWTLMLLLIGLLLGCVNAWHWVKKEDQEIHKEQEEEDV